LIFPIVNKRGRAYIKAGAYICAMNKTGIGTRVLNFLTDTLLVFLLSYFIYKLHPYYVSHGRVVYLYFHWIFWPVLFLYYILFEGLFARTPGKFLTYSRVVVTASGRKPGFGRVLLRSLLRLTLIDLFFYPFFEKMLHDQLSGTDVVEV
jgi:uncharacterized RDD family membrane protein YckC